MVCDDGYRYLKMHFQVNHMYDEDESDSEDKANATEKILSGEYEVCICISLANLKLRL